MSLLAAYSLTVAARRRAMHLAHWNAGLWAIGNGLASTSLVTYLALELGAEGLAISLILATPRLIGLLRMAAPALMNHVGNRRSFCLGGFLISNALLLALPAFSAPGWFADLRYSLALLVALWSGYHLFEYFATVALYDWLSDLAPRRIRGRFFGRRERWLTLGRIVGMVYCGLFAYTWTETHPTLQRWVGYALPAAVGAGVMLLSVVPLAWMAAPVGVRKQSAGQAWRELLVPFADRRFMQLVCFGCWFSIVNGVTQAAQGIYPARVLGFHLFWMLGFESLMRFGQSGVCPWVGRFADRFGNRPMMIAAQVTVSLGPLFYLAATPEQPFWLVGAWMVWIAYAGLNVTLPTLILKLAPTGQASAYVATWFAVSGLCYGVSTVAGGLLFDALNRTSVVVTLHTWALNAYDCLFLVGFVGRLLGALFLLSLAEPGAYRLWQVAAALWQEHQRRMRGAP